MTSGWLFDTYYIKDTMVSWIKTGDSIQRIEDTWTPSIFVACDDIHKLELLSTNKKISKYIKDTSFVERFEKVTDLTKSKVLQIQLADSSDVTKLAGIIDGIEKYGTFRLYNVDVPPAQLYFYEKDIFPFGKFSISKDTWTANNGIKAKLVLGREKAPLLRPKQEGTSYFSYGKMYFKPSGAKLQGRIHIDKSSCFIWNNDFDIHGLYEIARICRLPLQIAARASIGKCMSSLQFYNATKRGLLIPWRPTMAEAFKTRKDLLIGDRGGLIFEPQLGVFEHVAELDFASLFGSIMEKKNISAETISCSCCPDSQNKVPDLGYNICKRRGIVPQSLEILLEKRKMYGNLLKKFPDDKIYDARKTALKWILVTSFGYLGFNNAKFGRIDAHMAVCAFARQILLQAVRISERHGFRVLHGIVDSLWLYKKDSTKTDMEKLKAEIEKKTGFEMSLDIYKWIVFVSSKEDDIIPVANRYFGAFEDGKLKLRGIELRRHDTPWFFKRCQMEILRILATGNNLKEVRQLLPKAEKIYKKYLDLLYQHKVPLEELAFTISASKDASEYKTNTVQTDAILQLKEEGESIRAGQRLQYVISDYSRKRKHSTPLKMSDGKYDVNRYAELLAECYSSIVKPFSFEGHRTTNKW